MVFHRITFSFSTQHFSKVCNMIFETPVEPICNAVKRPHKWHQIIICKLDLLLLIAQLSNLSIQPLTSLNTMWTSERQKIYINICLHFVFHHSSLFFTLSSFCITCFMPSYIFVAFFQELEGQSPYIIIFMAFMQLNLDCGLTLNLSCLI